MSRSGSKSKLSSATKGRSSKKDSSVEPEVEIEAEVPQLAWRILNEDQTRELKNLSVVEIARSLADVLSLSHHEDNLKEAAQLDYFVSGYWFAAREKKFSDEQTSAFFTLLHTLLDNLKSKHLSLQENIKELQQHMVGVGLESAPCSLKCFSRDVAVMALRYIHSGLFQHYRLYEYLFTEQQEEERISTKLYVDIPPDANTLSPPPLEEAVPLEFYEICLSPKPPQPQSPESDEQRSNDSLRNEFEKGSNESSPLLNVSAEEVRTMMESMAETTLTALQVEVSKKMKKQEETMLSRISTLEKNLSST